MKKCELLVPAGGNAQFIAAVENGADAVYIGGPMYNARMGAGNFTLEEMKKAVRYAHLRDVKVYVTMNTLLEDEEIDSAVGFAKLLYEMGVDALIIQDLGLGQVIKNIMPDFELHLSTQATVYNRRGLEAAKLLGYDRAVLARELTLSEIAQCSRDTIIETEVFVHGALCFCYSGQCQMSRFIGGRSGNKGRCAQPCRLPYTFSNTEGKKFNASQIGEYPLSPKDLCMIERLGELAEAGVASLKIEGRMKSPEYVAVVTAIYRKYLDMYYAKGKYQVSDEDMQNLLQIFNRGGFTDGYADGEPEEELMSGVIPKNQGVLVGTVKKSASGGLLADVELQGRLQQGDIVEIRGSEIFSTKVTYYESRGKHLVRIGDMKAAVRSGDRVYRIISEALMKQAGESFLNTDYEGGKFHRKSKVEMVFTAEEGQLPRLNVKTAGCSGKNISAEVIADVICTAAENRPAQEEDVAEKLSKTGGTPFEVGEIKVFLKGNPFIPVSMINELRREALVQLADKKTKSYIRKADYKVNGCGIKLEHNADIAQKLFEIYYDSVNVFTNEDFETLKTSLEEAKIPYEDVRFLLPLRDMAANIMDVMLTSEEKYEKIVPYISNMTKGTYDEWLESNLDGAAEMIRNFGGRVYVGNIGWVKPFADRGIEVYGDFGLNITNHQAAAAYKQLGMTENADALESKTAEAGAFPLMITEHPMPEGTLVDRKGARYSVHFDELNHKTIIKSKDRELDWQAVAELWKNTKKTVRIYV